MRVNLLLCHSLSQQISCMVWIYTCLRHDGQLLFSAGRLLLLLPVMSSLQSSSGVFLRRSSRVLDSFKSWEGGVELEKAGKRSAGIARIAGGRTSDVVGNMLYLETDTDSKGCGSNS